MAINVACSVGCVAVNILPKVPGFWVHGSSCGFINKYFLSVETPDTTALLKYKKKLIIIIIIIIYSAIPR